MFEENQGASRKKIPVYKQSSFANFVLLNCSNKKNESSYINISSTSNNGDEHMKHIPLTILSKKSDKKEKSKNIFRTFFIKHNKNCPGNISRKSSEANEDDMKIYSTNKFMKIIKAKPNIQEEKIINSKKCLRLTRKNEPRQEILKSFANTHLSSNNNSTFQNSIKDKEKNKIKIENKKQEIKFANTVYNKIYNNVKSNFDIQKYYEETLTKNSSTINLTNGKTDSYNNFNKRDLISSKINTNCNINVSPKVTFYLERKKFGVLPVTFPLCLSYNQNFDTYSEKNRIEKIVSKFNCLKTYIEKEPDLTEELIKEFIFKNGIYDSKYFTPEKIKNFEFFIRHPFNPSPKKTMVEILMEGLNYKIDPKEYFENRNNVLSPINIYEFNQLDKDLIKSNKNSYKKYLFQKIEDEKIRRFEKRNLKSMLTPSFSKLKRSNSINILTKNEDDLINDFKSLFKQKKSLIDNNKFVPNLCLIGQETKEMYKEVIEKHNRKIDKKLKKIVKVKNITKRLYYNSIEHEKERIIDSLDYNLKLSKEKIEKIKTKIDLFK